MGKKRTKKKDEFEVFAKEEEKDEEKSNEEEIEEDE